MRLETAAIDRYGPLYDCRPPCGDGLTVVSGPNEAGKTLYLEALLQLLDPAVEPVMEPPPRVADTPTGRVVVEHDGDRFECTGERTLTDRTPIEPIHLQTVFVVRDNDLRLPSSRAYYTSLIEKLGDIHTTEIDAITSALKDRGRLTDTRLDVSSDQRHDDAGTVRDDAAALADEIRTYVERIEAEGLDELDARRLQLARRLRDVRAELGTQEEAATVADYRSLAERLDTYRARSEQLAALTAFDRPTLDALRDLRRELERDREELRELEGAIEETAETVEERTDTLETLRKRRSDLERRQDAVETARSALESSRDRQAQASGADRRGALARSVAVAGVLAAGAAGGLGAVTDSDPAIALGGVLLVLSLVSAALASRASRRRTAVESARTTVVHAARDAGFDVDRVEAVGPRLESFERSLQTTRERETRTDQALETARRRLDQLGAEYETVSERIAEREASLDEQLAGAGVETVEAYEQTVEHRDELERDRGSARQTLVDRFGEPAASEPAERARAWERELEATVAEVDVDAVDPDVYDERERERLEAERERVQRAADELETRLQEHDERLDAFERRAHDLETQPFVGESVALASRSKAGLEALASDLDRVVTRIETDAEISRKALTLFEEIERREEQKLTELFDPDGPASRTFAGLTDGRYTEVAYDPEAHDLVVHRADGRTLSPDVLSQGTRDQLYFATRISLAHQLLGTEPGFFLLDDPLLGADPDRLRQGFRTLLELAERGWQILYLTAKREVRETMVAEFDLEHVELDPLTTR